MHDQTPAATTPKERALLGSEDVNKWHRAAMRALGDNEARRKWADSKAGGPVTVMLLCEDVSRLQIERAEMLELLRVSGANLETAAFVIERLGDKENAEATRRMAGQILPLLEKADARSMPSPNHAK